MKYYYFSTAMLFMDASFIRYFNYVPDNIIFKKNNCIQEPEKLAANSLNYRKILFTSQNRFENKVQVTIRTKIVLQSFFYRQVCNCWLRNTVDNEEKFPTTWLYSTHWLTFLYMNVGLWLPRNQYNRTLGWKKEGSMEWHEFKTE